MERRVVMREIMGVHIPSGMSVARRGEEGDPGRPLPHITAATPLLWQWNAIGSVNPGGLPVEPSVTAHFLQRACAGPSIREGNASE